MDKKKTILIVLLSATFGLMLFVGLNIDFTLQEESFHANVTVMDSNETDYRAGLVTEPRLNFGEVSPEMPVRKKLEMSSEKPTKVTLDSKGNISEKLTYKDVIYIEGDHEEEVQFSSNETGYYSGNLEVKMSIAQNRVSEEWLELRQLYSSYQ